MTIRSIAVFGSSEPREGDPLYEQARTVGRLLAADGFRIVTGGYGGVMEGASRGAREAGGAAMGVVCAAFRGRAPNRFLTEVVETADLHERTRTLIEAADGYVVLWGKSGTLAEAALVWALVRAGSLDARPVLVLGASWERLLRHLAESGMLGGPELESTRVVRAPDQVPGILRAMLPGPREE